VSFALQLALCSGVSRLWIQPAIQQKYLKEKLSELNIYKPLYLSIFPEHYSNYLFITGIILNIASNLDAI
jgi:hypothetical protein